MQAAYAVELTQKIRERGLVTSWITDVALIAGGTLLLTLLAQVRIPMFPVPITGQTLGVLLIGAGLGASRSVASVLAYYGLGIAGVPVFAGGVGLATFAGPTAGFLLAFVPAAALVGYLCERGWDRSYRWALLTFLLGHAIIFACGVTWLSVLIGFQPAVTAGLVPFLPGMVIKTLIATALLPLLWDLRSIQHRNQTADEE